MQPVQYHSHPVMTIGIIGGGQLGKMMVNEATTLGFEVVVLDPDPHSPAGRLAGSQIVAEYTDPDGLAENRRPPESPGGSGVRRPHLRQTHRPPEPEDGARDGVGRGLALLPRGPALTLCTDAPRWIGR
jgi:hypothetical protein